MKEEKVPIQNSGFYWHCHHEELLEWCYSYEEREKYIRTQKPVKEIELRLHLFKPVQGNLPKEVIEAWRACDEALRAYDEARRAYNEARRAYDEARRAYDEAILKNETEIEELHKKECPNCPWDGETIFPEQK